MHSPPASLRFSPWVLGCGTGEGAHHAPAPVLEGRQGWIELPPQQTPRPSASEPQEEYVGL